MGSAIDDTLRQILFLTQHLGRDNPQAVIGAVLMDLGFLAKGRGYRYLKLAIQVFHKDPAQLITYGVYTEVAKIIGEHATRDQVETGIRRVVKEAWEARDPAAWDMYFPNGLTRRKNGPSNAEFISGMSDVLELWEGCRKALEKSDGEVDGNEKE